MDQAIIIEKSIFIVAIFAITMLMAMYSTLAERKIAAWLQVFAQALHHLGFGLVVKVDHHVTQEDHVELPHRRQRIIQVDRSEGDP